MILNSNEQRTLEDAINALREIMGIDGIERIAQNGAESADGLLSIKLNGHKQLFLVEVKNVDRRITIANVREQLDQVIARHCPACRPLLVTRFVTPAMAEECRKLDLPFLDTAGNLYLKTDYFLADIRGNRRPHHGPRDEYRANTVAGLKITFALLCQPALAAASYREVARMAKVALGSIGPVLRDLSQRGYLETPKTGNARLDRYASLLQEWVSHYPAKLRPTLGPRRYYVERERLTALPVVDFGALWGGEYAAERLDRYLKAEHFAIYMFDKSPKRILTNTHGRLAPDGNTELLQAFWHPELLPQHGDLVPPLLIYADLMATADSRNLEAARLIHERYLTPPVH
jgi:hypothetical protein